MLPTEDQRSFQKPNVIKFFRETAPVQSYGRTQYPTAAPYPHRTATIYSQTRTTNCFLENRNWSWFHRPFSVDTFLRTTYSKIFVTWRGSDLWENISNLTDQIICSSRLTSTLYHQRVRTRTITLKDFCVVFSELYHRQRRLGSANNLSQGKPWLWCLSRMVRTSAERG